MAVTTEGTPHRQGDEFDNAHSVDLTAQVKKGQGSIKVLRREPNGEWIDANDATYQDQNLWLEGEGFKEGAEVVLNFDRLDGDSTNTRISAQAHNGEFKIQAPLFGHPGTWRITAYVPDEELHGKPDKHERVLLQADQATLIIKPHRV